MPVERLPPETPLPDDHPLKQGAMIVFTIVKLPIPGQEKWVAVVSRVSLLAADGSVARTIDA